MAEYSSHIFPGVLVSAGNYLGEGIHHDEHWALRQREHSVAHCFDIVFAHKIGLGCEHSERKISEPDLVVLRVSFEPVLKAARSFGGDVCNISALSLLAAI